MTFWNSKNKNEDSNASDEKEIASDEKEICFICVCRIAFARAADLLVYLKWLSAKIGVDSRYKENAPTRARAFEGKRLLGTVAKNI